MLRPALVADFAFIHELASRPDYAAFISDEDDAALARYVADHTSRLLIWEPSGQPAGFALFCEIGNASGAVELRRLALAEAGRGQGQVFLRALLDHAFLKLGAKRLWLDASSENVRAQATYSRAGFVLEGRLRNHWFRPVLGRTVDLILFGMMQTEWQALEPVPAQA